MLIRSWLPGRQQHNGPLSALTNREREAIKDPEPAPPRYGGGTFAMQERTMARCRPTLSAEDAEALTLLMSPAADEFAIALDRCGWMIVQQPQFGGRR